MNTQQVIQRFNLFAPPKAYSLLPGTKQSAVLLPLVELAGSAHILLCKRPAHMKHHPGEICLPGGKLERGDVSLKHTALRELHEELAIPQEQVQLIGELPSFSTLTGFSIQPYVGVLSPQTIWVPDPDEVELAFLLPLTSLGQERNWQTLSFYRHGREIKLAGFNTPHGLLWGATAWIVQNFTRQLALPV